MQPMKHLRVWHAMIAILATATYLAEDVEPLHQLLGFGIVVLIVVRLLMAIVGAGPLGLQRFYPKFRDLKLGTAATHPAISRTLLLGIAIALLGVTTTGVLMDQGKSLQSLPTLDTGPSLSGYLNASDDTDRPMNFRDGERDENEDEDGEDDEEGLLGEVHELFANLLVALVALHVGYLIVFKWPLARFMLFVRQPRKAVAPKVIH